MFTLLLYRFGKGLHWIRMGELPITKYDLRCFLARVHDEVERREGEVLFSSEKNVRALLCTGDSENVA